MEGRHIEVTARSSTLLDGSAVGSACEEGPSMLKHNTDEKEVEIKEIFLGRENDKRSSESKGAAGCWQKQLLSMVALFWHFKIKLRNSKPAVKKLSQAKF
uniref:Uncharacterized protein n=1 Tax=Oryza nivara TaxID=4536 RepID=A0A0E0HRU8_ORYNI